MNAISPRKNNFGRYDRIWLGKSAYRYVRKDEDGAHQLQLVENGLVTHSFNRVTDAQIAVYQRRKAFKVEPAYFAEAQDEMRARHDDTSLLALSEEESRTVFWKTEWCTRFNDARLAPDSTFRPKMTPKDLATFIEREKVAMNRWYIRRYGEPRPLGRSTVVGYDDNGDDIKQRKDFDFPSPTTLRNWLRLYARTGDRMAAFAPRHHRCGNRKQLHPEYEKLIEKCVLRYADRSLPTRKDILDLVEIDLNKLRKKRGDLAHLKLVSQSTIDRRIARLEPFYVAVGRLGPDRAMRRFQMVGRGVEVDLPMERVEMDDWEADLQVLLTDAGAWENMDDEQRRAVKRVRCIVTAAIDVRTRCIVGINVSEMAPSTPAAKAALRTITEDKTRMAADAGAQHPWEMHGRPDGLYTDGGPVFQGEFRDAARQCGIDFTRPDPDPRKRGHIEAFFRYLRRVCRFFPGQTFSNSVVKADYPAEQLASITVDEFRKAVIRFIVDVYHNRVHRGLAGATPRSAWERDTARFTPSEVTPAQRRAAFGFRHPDVALDAQGVLYLGISYASEALAELKRIYDGRVNLVIDPEDLGDVFVEIPLRHRKHMQAFAPIATHGAFLEVHAVDRRFAGRTLATHLLLNEGVRQYVREAKQKGDIVRIEANESLTMQGRLAAQRAGFASNALTQEDYDKISRQYRAKARQSTGQDPVRDAPTPGGQAGMGKVVATSRRTRPPAKPPKPLDLHDGADGGHQTAATDEHAVRGAEPKRGEKPADTAKPAPAAKQETPPAVGMPRPSRSINQGDDD